MAYMERERSTDNPQTLGDDDPSLVIDHPLLATEQSTAMDHGQSATWKIMIVDDEAEIHRITKFALQQVSFAGRKLSFISAYSGTEAEILIRENPDTAIILLDVVMENIDTGLRLVQYIRETVGNQLVRIILRTGQPHEAPEEAIIREYDISDYKTKTELTRQKLLTTIILSLRTFLYLRTLQMNQKEVEKLNAILFERNAELQKAKDSAEMANHTKTEFLSTMSHELRTPLSVILMQSEIVQAGVYGPLTKKQENSLHLIHRSGQHLLALINDILDLSRIEAGRFELDLASTSANMVCEFSLHAVQALAVAQNIKIQAVIEDKIPMLYTDERRLVQILVNLLKNAIKFTPAGAEIGLLARADPAQHMVIFIVWDTGIGIAAEDIGRLFQPFVQLDSSLTRKYEGSGLGLAIVARMLNLMGGSIGVESQVGQGSRFIIKLPWKPERAK